MEHMGTISGLVGLMVVAALSTGQTVGIVAVLWLVVIGVVATHQLVHRRRESNRQAERLDRLGTRQGNDSPQRERR